MNAKTETTARTAMYTAHGNFIDASRAFDASTKAPEARFPVEHPDRITWQARRDALWQEVEATQTVHTAAVAEWQALSA
jgi:hypothetical protein